MTLRNDFCALPPFVRDVRDVQRSLHARGRYLGLRLRTRGCVYDDMISMTSRSLQEWRREKAAGNKADIAFIFTAQSFARNRRAESRVAGSATIRDNGSRGTWRANSCVCLSVRRKRKKTFYPLLFEASCHSTSNGAVISSEQRLADTNELFQTDEPFYVNCKKKVSEENFKCF